MDSDIYSAKSEIPDSPQFESSCLEFKQVVPSRDALLATVCALANTAGGELRISVDDRGRPVGMDERDILSIEEKISSWIAQGIQPFLIPLIRIQRTEKGPIRI